MKSLRNRPGALANFQGPPNIFLVTSRRGFDEKKMCGGPPPPPHVPGPDHPLQSSRCRVRLQVCKRTSPDACVQGPTAPLHTSLLSGNLTCPRPGKPLMAASARQRPCANARLAQGQATTRGAPPRPLPVGKGPLPSPPKGRRGSWGCGGATCMFHV